VLFALHSRLLLLILMQRSTLYTCPVFGGNYRSSWPFLFIFFSYPQSP
jgi:hypothetical protein